MTTVISRRQFSLCNCGSVLQVVVLGRHTYFSWSIGGNSLPRERIWSIVAFRSSLLPRSGYPERTFLVGIWKDCMCGVIDANARPYIPRRYQYRCTNVDINRMNKVTIHRDDSSNVQLMQHGRADMFVSLLLTVKV